MLERFRRSLARVLVRGLTQVRSYYGAGGGRLTASWRSPTSSADTELHIALTTLRNRSRELIRNSSYARRAKVIVVNNVVGSGIGLQAQVRPSFRERLDERVNDAIEAAWSAWCRADACHVSGKLHFADIERIVMGEIFEAGEVLVRKHYRAFGRSRVPVGLEIIEADRLADDYAIPPGLNSTNYRMGVEHDAYLRPVAYWLRERHPGDVRPSIGSGGGALIRVPAGEIMHLYLADRWPQTRGVPWLHSAMRRLNDMEGYTEAEIVAARASAMYLAFIKSEEEGPLDPASANVAGQQQLELEPGLQQRLAPGEDIVFHSPSRPNSALDPFLRYLLREVSAGVGVSYESLSRDYSQSNYSSSRLALLDDRDLWRVLQQWFIRSFREPLHREWLQAAVLGRAIAAVPLEEYATRPDKFEAAKFKPRGWSWVDPTKEVEAYVAAIKAGLTTRTDVIAQTADGRDVEEVDDTRRQELDAAGAKQLVYDTDPEVFAPPPPAPAPPPAADTDTDDEPPARLVSFGGLKR
jgi:lambda family phage portal protein